MCQEPGIKAMNYGTMYETEPGDLMYDAARLTVPMHVAGPPWPLQCTVSFAACMAAAAYRSAGTPIDSSCSKLHV